MTLLIVGLLGWSLIHLFPSLSPAAKSSMVEKMGPLPYKGLFAVGILLSLVAIVSGWKSTTPELLYAPAAWSVTATRGLMLIALLFFFAARLPTRIKQFVRHPQLTGVTLWSIAHLLSNGEDRSVLLFGVMGVWALISMLTISKRDGAWQKPAPATTAQDVILAVVAVGLYVAVTFAHPWLSGVALI